MNILYNLANRSNQSAIDLALVSFAHPVISISKCATFHAQRPTFVLDVWVASQSKPMGNAAEKLEMIILFVLSEYLLRYVTRLCRKSMINFRAGKEHRLCVFPIISTLKLGES